MARRPIISALALLALSGAPAAARAADAPPLAARTTSCTTGAEPALRAATFTGSMPALAATNRMQMRFVLQQRLGPSGPFKRVEVPGWGDWERSDPGRPGFVFSKHIEALVAPAAYKAVVTFRWYDAKGRVQRQARRTTGACEQPDQRPDLVLARFDGATRTPDTADYGVQIRNDGRSTAPAFGLTLTIGSITTQPVTFGPLVPGASDQATVAGPRCTPGQTVTITVDAGGVVDERDEGDVVKRLCPLG